MLEMTNENFARLLRGLTIAVGNRRNRILLYQFLAAEIRALHLSYGVGDGESYKRALTFAQVAYRCAPLPIGIRLLRCGPRQILHRPSLGEMRRHTRA